MRKLKFPAIFLALMLLSGCGSELRYFPEGVPEGPPPVMREFRAAWVATVANIDWPSRPGLSVEEQKLEALAILDTASAMNLNAIVFQVRPQCDALYQSDLEPWSYYLTGEQGRGPDPVYDPLAFWVEEAHKRGLELHAWFNPYRAHHPAGKEISEQSPAFRHPDWVHKVQGGYTWLDPSIEAVQDHSHAVVMDVVKRYDIDGVHFDDYFYPYGDGSFPDDSTWALYRGKLSRKDWRREHVNQFIKRVYESIKKEKRWVKFGLSPFGIWRPHYPASIRGFDQHNMLYADARLWLNKGWIDYWTPQLYWPVNQVPQSFPVLLGWWSKENYQDRHLWPGLYTSRRTGEKGQDELINEIMITRGMQPFSPGHVHFSMKPLVSNRDSLSSGLKATVYREPALVPSSPWLDKKQPVAPQLRAETQNDTLTAHWTGLGDVPAFRWVLQYRIGSWWKSTVLPGHQTEWQLPLRVDRIVEAATDSTEAVIESKWIKPEEVTVKAVSRTGIVSQPVVKRIDK